MIYNVFFKLIKVVIGVVNETSLVVKLSSIGLQNKSNNIWKYILHFDQICLALHDKSTPHTTHTPHTTTSHHTPLHHTTHHHTRTKVFRTRSWGAHVRTRASPDRHTDPACRCWLTHTHTHTHTHLLTIATFPSIEKAT